MMYHHVQSDRCSNELGVFEEHLAYISQHFVSLFPTKERLPDNAICLVFDDGYFDFYTFIYPLLKKYKLKALLAVVPKVILDDTDLEDHLRLGHEHNALFENYEDATFCTYKELKEMSESGYVQVVSHSFSHTNMLEEGVDVHEELVRSKEMIEEKLGVKVETFVYPFGKYNKAIHEKTMQYYTYAFRIGNAVNKDFNGIHGVIYRIDGDFLSSPSTIFSPWSMMKFKLKMFFKQWAGNR